MYGAIREDIDRRLTDIAAGGLHKAELALTTPQSGHVDVEGRGSLLNLCANNYLGLASHPDIIAAAISAAERWGVGMASVRFICGTQTLHLQLEERLSNFLGTDGAILFGSCFEANCGLFEALLTEEDAVISDELNHASIIDGIRLCKARRLRFKNGDMDELEARLRETRCARSRLIATDGVFSMDGHLAKLDALCDLADRHDALVMVDDSHAVGIVGQHGRGTHDFHDVTDRVDILTGTLGKAMGGASGGYVAGRRGIIDLLRQRARPYLFSNSLAPPIVGATLRALDLIERSDDLRETLARNTAYFRARIVELGFTILPGTHPIVPVMIGDERDAKRCSESLIEHGVYAVSFSYPVVPLGKARIRTQMSAAHTVKDLDFALEQFDRAHRVLAEHNVDERGETVSVGPFEPADSEGTEPRDENLG
jgi:glycine C-acetyltransferase